MCNPVCLSFLGVGIKVLVCLRTHVYLDKRVTGRRSLAAPSIGNASGSKSVRHDFLLIVKLLLFLCQRCADGYFFIIIRHHLGSPA